VAANNLSIAIDEDRIEKSKALNRARNLLDLPRRMRPCILVMRAKGFDADLLDFPIGPSAM
jgi:hypothetical protein